MKRTIVYVFGPRRLASRYFSNDIMDLEEGGWLKIGKTTCEDGKDKWDSAIGRIYQEVRTGIPEVCQLFDVFEYPLMNGNVDDEIRTLLTDDVYILENSKAHNKEVEKYEIKAGREFVYGVKRNQVLNAIAKFERNLILQNYGKGHFDDLMTLIKNNAVDEVPFEPNENNDTTDVKDSKSDWCNQLWDWVVSELEGKIKEHINNPKGRPYIFINSKNSSLSYSIGYSVRYNLTTVEVLTTNGESGRDKVDSFIRENNILTSIPGLKRKQGAKNKDKWAWSISDSFDKPDDELAKWFVEKILLFYRIFERINMPQEDNIYESASHTIPILP